MASAFGPPALPTLQRSPDATLGMRLAAWRLTLPADRANM
jgi:hypothetical protein